MTALCSKHGLFYTSYGTSQAADHGGLMEPCPKCVRDKNLLRGLKEFHAEIRRRDYQGIRGLSAKISGKDYMDMLEILPPLKWSKGVFYMSEFLTGDLTTKFYKEGRYYYAEVVNFRDEFPGMTEKEYYTEYR